MFKEGHEIKRILIIKLSALGDFVMSFRSFEAIRNHYPNAHITLMTTKPYKRLAAAAHWFDHVVIDARPAIGKLRQIFQLRKTIITGNFDLVIDLQNNDRTSMYYHLTLPHQPLWCGVAKGCDYYHSRKAQKKWHTLDREKAQLAQLDIKTPEFPNLDWLQQAAGGQSYRMNKQSLLIVAGCSPAHPEKRWPVENYIALIHQASEMGWSVVLIGTADDAVTNAEIKQKCPQIRDLTGKTNLLELAIIGTQAGLAIGNDTGPMHLLASNGCPSVVIFGGSSNPKRSAPRGAHVMALQNDDISLIDVEKVVSMIPYIVSSSETNSD